MKKSLWLILLLSILFSFTLSACDKEKNEPSNDDTNQSTNNEQNADKEDNNSENTVVCQHTFGDWIVEKQATCKESGILTRVCLKCSESEETNIAKTNNHTEATNEAVDATCDKTGLTEGKYCSLCEKVLVEQIEIPLKPHTYDDKYDETCNNCDYVRDAECAHLETEVLPGKSETCTSAGLTDGSKCKKCGEILVEQEVIPALGHKYATVVTEPTCTEQGYTTYTCICGDSYIIEIAASGHNFASITVNSPTCTASGYESCMDCSRCGASFYTILDPLGHDYQNGACIVCGDIQLKDGLNFTSNGDGTCYVSGFGTCEDTVIVIPSIYNGETVTGIGAGAFSNQTTIISVTIPETVTSIGNNAFRNCTKVETIYYNAICIDDLDYMNGVFFNVGGANHGFTLVIGKDVTRIPACLFHPTSTYGASEHKIKILRFEAGSVCESIGESAFQYCGLRSVELPKSVKSIEYQAFYANEISNVYYGGSTLDLENVTISCAAINGATIYTYSETEPTTDGNFWHYVDGDITVWEEYLAPTYSEGLEYTLNDDGESYSVTGIGTCTDTEIIIPSTYQDKPVTTIDAGAFHSCISITNITIPYSVTNIVCNGFFGTPFLGCSNLKCFEVDEENPMYKSIDGSLYTKDGTMLIQYASGRPDESFTVPEGVINICIGAIHGCNNLTSIGIPSTVLETGIGNFAYCTNLVSITVDKDNPVYKSIDGNLYRINDDDVTLTLIKYAMGKTETSFSMPYNLTIIDDYAFWDCDKFIYNQYDNAYYLGDENNPYAILMYAKSTDISSCNIHENAKILNSYSFSNCASLTDITIPEGVTCIGYSAFECCSSLTNITLPESLVYIGQCAFYDCSNLVEITIPKGVTSIRTETFDGCYKLASIEIPDGVTSIGFSAFGNCSNLTSVTIPDSVTSIARLAFAYCSKLESINLGSNSKLTIIEDRAFDSCSALKSFMIPKNITHIGSSAFSGCSSLSDVYIKDVEAWLNSSFGGSGLSVNLNYDGALHILDENGNEVTELVIPDSITSIGSYAFRNAKNLTSVTIPDSVTSIGDYAFALCSSLENLVFSSRTLYVGKYAFNDCNITDIYYTGTYTPTVNIDVGNDCLSNAEVHFG